MGVICHTNYGQGLDLKVGSVPSGKILAIEAKEKIDSEANVEQGYKCKADKDSCIVTTAY